MSNNYHVMVIFEAGINHNGQKDILKQLIDSAVECGADAIKFQKRNVIETYSFEFLKQPRNDRNPYGWKTQYDQKMGIELTKETYDWINFYTKSLGIHWFCSAWDKSSVLFLRQYDLPYNKIASAILPKKDIVEMIAEEGKYTFISTGMVSDWKEIDEVVEIFNKYGTEFELMHTVSSYPMNLVDANLRMIQTLKKRYGVEKIGWSDHSIGRILSLCAIGMGITSLEKHGTLSRAMYGSDQAASLEVSDFQKLMVDVRGLEKAMGTGERILTPEELVTKKKLRGD